MTIMNPTTDQIDAAVQAYQSARADGESHHDAVTKAGGITISWI